jgi:hypothetical protein
MKQKRLNLALLCGLGAMALPLLSGCGNSSGAKQAHYYKVDYYTDFAGIDYSKKFDPTTQPDISKAILVGHDYVLASTTSSRATHFGDDKIYDPTQKTSGHEAYDKISLQNAITGHHYSFKGWKGTYGQYSSQVTSAPQSSSSANTSGAATSGAFRSNGSQAVVPPLQTVQIAVLQSSSGPKVQPSTPNTSWAIANSMPISLRKSIRIPLGSITGMVRSLLAPKAITTRPLGNY